MSDITQFTDAVLDLADSLCEPDPTFEHAILAETRALEALVEANAGTERADHVIAERVRGSGLLSNERAALEALNDARTASVGQGRAGLIARAIAKTACVSKASIGDDPLDALDRAQNYAMNQLGRNLETDNEGIEHLVSQGVDLRPATRPVGEATIVGQVIGRDRHSLIVEVHTNPATAGEFRVDVHGTEWEPDTVAEPGTRLLVRFTGTLDVDARGRHVIAATGAGPSPTGERPRATGRIAVRVESVAESSETGGNRVARSTHPVLAEMHVELRPWTGVGLSPQHTVPWRAMVVNGHLISVGARIAAIAEQCWELDADHPLAAAVSFEEGIVGTARTGTHAGVASCLKRTHPGQAQLEQALIAAAGRPGDDNEADAIVQNLMRWGAIGWGTDECGKSAIWHAAHHEAHRRSSMIATIKTCAALDRLATPGCDAEQILYESARDGLDGPATKAATLGQPRHALGVARSLASAAGADTLAQTLDLHYRNHGEVNRWPACDTAV